MEKQTIIFIGPQGSGKGTQIELLTNVLKEKDKETRIVDIQTGRRFRALAVREEGFTENKVSKALESGAIQPLFLSVVLWGDAFHQHVDPECHLLIDGVPRRVEEAKVLESALEFYGRKHLTVINLETAEEVVRERMEKRARTDDIADSIETRLKWYRDDTIPVLEYYRERPNTTVADVEGANSIEGVHNEIMEHLKIT